MDNFFRDFDPYLTEAVKETVPENKLSSIVNNYTGTDTKEGHLEALVALLSSIAEGKDKSSTRNDEERKKFIGVLALVYSALDDWPKAASTWRSLVSIDDRETLEDHPKRDLAAMFNLGISQNHAQQYLEAEKTIKRLLPMLEGGLGKSSEQYVGSLNALMLAVGKQGKIEEVRKLYSEHEAIVKQHTELQQYSYTETAKKMLKEAEHEARER